MCRDRKRSNEVVNEFKISLKHFMHEEVRREGEGRGSILFSRKMRNIEVEVPE
jgi:hypothetical protein